MPVKAPCGGEAAGTSPVDRAKLGAERFLLTDATGVPLGCVVAPANRHDSPLLRPTLETLARFDTGHGIGGGLPEQITVHLDAGYDSTRTRDLLAELGCQAVISQKGVPLQAGARCVVERTNSWHNRGFAKLLICTERHTRVIEAFITLANAVIVIRRLIRTAWTASPSTSSPARRRDLFSRRPTSRPWFWPGSSPPGDRVAAQRVRVDTCSLSVSDAPRCLSPARPGQHTIAIR